MVTVRVLTVEIVTQVVKVRAMVTTGINDTTMVKVSPSTMLILDVAQQILLLTTQTIVDNLSPNAQVPG